MEGVDFGEEISEALGEDADAETLEVVFLFELGEDAGGFGFDGEMATEEVAFGDVDGANFAGPVVDILK